VLGGLDAVVAWSVGDQHGEPRGAIHLRRRRRCGDRRS
jgi:hypothetical protein